MYGVPAKREVINRDVTLNKRETSELYKGFELENNRRCTLLTSVNAEGNPYHEELTGKKNINIIKGWKLKEITPKGVSQGNNYQISYSVSFDEAYSISVTESHDKGSTYTIDNHSEKIENNNFSKSISDVIEEVISSTLSETDDTHWEDSFMNEISEVNEKHTEENRSHEEHEENSSGKNQSSENGNNENESRNTNVSNSSTIGESNSDTSGESNSDTSGESKSNTSGESKSNTSGESNSSTSGESNSNTTGDSNSNTTGNSSSNTTGESNSSTTGTSHDITHGTDYSITNGNDFSITNGNDFSVTNGTDYSKTNGTDYSLSHGEESTHNGNLGGGLWGVSLGYSYNHGTSGISVNSSNHSSNRGSNHSSTTGSNHSSTNSTNESSTKEKNTSVTHEWNSSTTTEKNHSNTNETNKSKTNESNKSETNETNKSETNETNQSKTKETNHSNTNETNKSKTRDKSEGTSHDRGISQSKTSGTTKDHSIGKSDTTGYSEGKSDSISNSESFTKANGGSKSITNSNERSKTTGRTEDNTTSTEIGYTTGNSESTSTTENHSISTTEDHSHSKSVTYSITDNVYNNGNTACQIMFYSKVLRSTQITSCYDLDENHKYSINSRSLIYVDVDENYIESIKRNEVERELQNSTDYYGLMVACQPNTQDYTFIPEENILTKAISIANDVESSYFNPNAYLISGIKLKGSTEISDLPKKLNLQRRKVLKMQNNNLVFLDQDGNDLYNTKTEFACNLQNNCEAYFIISKLNHLEIKTDNDVFAPVGDDYKDYAIEFNDSYDNPDMPVIGEIKNNPDDEPLPGESLSQGKSMDKFIEQLEKDEINTKILFEQTEQNCRNILWYCNCNSEKFSTDYENNNDEDADCENDELIFNKGEKNNFFKVIKSYFLTDNQERNCYYSREEINYICNKDNQNHQNNQNSQLMDPSNKTDCENYEECNKLQNYNSFLYKPNNKQCDEVMSKCKFQNNPINDLVVGAIQNNSNQYNSNQNNNDIHIKYTAEQNLADINQSKYETILEEQAKNLMDVNNFKIKEKKDKEKIIQEGGVVLWSSVKPEHQNFIVGWNGNGLTQQTEKSYLVVTSEDYKNKESYDGFTLFDSVGIPIWKYDVLDPPNKMLDTDGYYLPVKYGYPFKYESITKNIPTKYLYDINNNEKKVPHLILPEGITYKGNQLHYGGCENIIKSNEGLESQNGRFRLILQNNGNLVFKDNQVTIWESKTANLWQGKGPYKLLVGNDGVMRILNVFDYVLMSTINNPNIKNDHTIKQKSFRLQVLNVGTFRIINENGIEVWNMWNHAKFHEFFIYSEHEFYNACSERVRNPNLPLITTYHPENSINQSGFDNSIIRVGEQLINRFTPEQYAELKLSNKYREMKNTAKVDIDLNSKNHNYIFDEYDNYYSTARLPLTGFHLKYQNILYRTETVDNEEVDINDSYFDLKPITDRNSKIVYGKLDIDGVFYIYDAKDNILFTTGIIDEVCKDSKKCFYFMYITPDEDGFVKIMKRSFKDKDYLDSLIWMYPPKKRLTKMMSSNEKLFLQNLESLIYRNDKEIDKDCRVSKERVDNELKKYLEEDQIDYSYLLNKPDIYCKDTLRYCNCQNENDPSECRKNTIKIFKNSKQYDELSEEIKDKNICKYTKHRYTEEDIDLICKNYGECTIINEFPCMTLRTKGVYLYGDRDLFYRYNITANTKLYLDEKTGRLELDGLNILDLQDKNLALPTEMRCVINNDVYGVELVDRNKSVIWEYPSKVYLSLNTDIKKYRQNNNTMVVDRNIFYLNKKNELKKCLEFKSDGLYNGNNKITKNFEEKGRTLYLKPTELYIQDYNDNIIENSVFKLYNPEEHNVSLTCKSNDKIVIMDQVTNNIIWSYPTQKFELIASDIEITQLRPEQELVYKSDTLNRFCLRINKYYLENIDSKNPIIIPGMNNKESIDYLETTEKGVFIHYGDKVLDLLEAFHIRKTSENNDKNSSSSNNDKYSSSSNNDKNSSSSNNDKNSSSSNNDKNSSSSNNDKNVYSLKCEEIYGILRTSIYHNDLRVLTLPLHEKKYEISEKDYLYYGEKLYNKDNDNEVCLTFENNELYTTLRKNNYTLPVKHNGNYDSKSYIYMKGSSLLFNDDEENSIVTVKEISDNNSLVGKCMNYHGSTRFVLYSSKTNSVYMEFPATKKKAILENDDIIYDILYIDDNGNFTRPCIRIDELKDENGKVITGEDNRKRIGLFFLDETNPNNSLTKNLLIYDEPNNNTLTFSQDEGILKFYDRNFLEKSFSQRDLTLKCERCNKFDNKNKLCAKILNKNGKELWRYPEIKKKEYISTDESTLDPITYETNLEYLLVDDYLYTNGDECVLLSESGFIYEWKNQKNIHKMAQKLHHIHLENDKKNKLFKIILKTDDGTKEIIMKNKNNSNRAELRCDFDYGYYVMDSEQNRLKNMLPREYGSPTKQYPNRRHFTKSDSTTDTLYVGDRIISDDGTVCAEITEEYEMVLGTNDQYKIPGNVYSIQLDKNNILTPLIINNNNIFENIDQGYKNNPPKSISLRCKKNNEDLFLALYDDDKNVVMDEKFTLCRKHKEYISGEKYNNELCESEKWGLGNGTTKCLILKRDSDISTDNNVNKLVDFRGNTILESNINAKIKIDPKTGNLIETKGNIGTIDITLLKTSHPDVKMSCNDDFEVIMSINEKIDSNKENIILKYRPKAMDCKDGLQSKSSDCHTIYKYETMESFKINAISLGYKYNINILQLTVKNNGSIIVNNDENNILIKDEWNRNKDYNYVLKCNNNNKKSLITNTLNSNDHHYCKFINDDTKEIIHIFKEDSYILPKEYTIANSFALGEKIMCRSAGLVLTNEGFKYRYIVNGEKKEEDFIGESTINIKNMVGELEIDSGYFETPSYDFKIKLRSKDGNTGKEKLQTIVPFGNPFNNTNGVENREVGITCKNGILEFYEIYKNERKVYYEYPKVATKLKPKPLYPGDKCGPQYNNQTCKNSAKSYCSRNGECVSSNDERSYAENGCQYAFNYGYKKCNQFPPNSCGLNYGKRKCTNNDKPYCNSKGECVSSDNKGSYIEHGCQSVFNHINHQCQQYPPNSCGPLYGDLKCQNPENPYCNINSKTKNGECVSSTNLKRFSEKGCNSEFNYGNQICPNYPKYSCGANYDYRKCKSPEKPCCNIKVNYGECVSGDLCYISKGCSTKYSIMCK